MLPVTMGAAKQDSVAWPVLRRVCRSTVVRLRPVLQC